MGYYWPEDGWDEKVFTDAGLPISVLPQVFGDVYLVTCIWYLVTCVVYFVFGMVHFVF